MTKEVRDNWIDRFRAKNYRLSLQVIESLFYRVYGLAVIIFVIARSVDAVNGPDFPGPLQRMPDIVVTIMIWSVIYPFLILIITPSKYRKGESKNNNNAI